MSTMLERAMRGETVEIGKIAAGTTITEGVMRQIWDAFHRDEKINLMDAEAGSYRELTPINQLPLVRK